MVLTKVIKVVNISHINFLMIHKILNLTRKSTSAGLSLYE